MTYMTGPIEADSTKPTNSPSFTENIETQILTHSSHDYKQVTSYQFFGPTLLYDIYPIQRLNRGFRTIVHGETDPFDTDPP